MQRLDAIKQRRSRCLSKYGSIEDVVQIKRSGTAYGDYSFTMCLDRGGFQAIPYTIAYKDQTMMVVVEGRSYTGLTNSWAILPDPALKK